MQRKLAIIGITFLSLSAMATKSSAQATHPANNVTAPAGVKGGYFTIDEMKEGVMHHYNVNYSIITNTPDMRFYLQSPYARTLSIEVKNNSGAVIKSWNKVLPSTTPYESWPRFGNGAYTMVVKSAAGVVLHEAPFTVE